MDALARHLLACAAWLTPGLPIPPDLLRHCAGHTDDDEAATRLFADALARLLDLALVERVEDGGGALVLHRLVAAFARTRLDRDARIRDRVEEAVVGLADHFLPANDPTPFRGWAGHLLAMASTAGRDATNAAIGLLHTAGYYSLLVADFGSATTMLEDAAKRAESLNGPDHPEVASTLGNLGLVQRARGDLDGALRSQTRALTIKEATYGPDHPEVARTLDNLGIVQYARGDLDGALRSQTRALTIEEAAYGPDHPEVARTLGNLGNVQRDLGQVGLACASYGRAVAIFSPRLGDDHPDTILARRLLGECEHSTEKRKPWWKRLWRR